MTGSGRPPGTISLLGRGGSRLALPFVFWLLALAVPAMPAAAAGTGAARVVTGRAERIDGALAGDLVSLGGDLVVSGRVEGDLIAWGGRVRLEPTAAIDGSVLLVGTTWEAKEGSRVGGRVLYWADLEEVAGGFLEGGLPAGAEALRRWSWGLRLGTLAAWLLAALLLSLAARTTVEECAEALRQGWLRAFAAGVTLLLAAVLVAWGVLVLCPPRFGLPILLFVGASALAAKIFGLVTVFVAVGRWISRRLGRKVPPALPMAATAGLLLLGGVRFVPVAGNLVWVAASLVGMGIAAGRLVGRRRATVELPVDRI